MKKLPEKWCIEVGEYNKNHPIIKYLNQKYNKSHDGSEKLYADLGNNSDCWPSNMWNIPQISFSDFERLVLKKKVNYEIYY